MRAARRVGPRQFDFVGESHDPGNASRALRQVGKAFEMFSQKLDNSLKIIIGLQAGPRPWVTTAGFKLKGCSNA